MKKVLISLVFTLCCVSLFAQDNRPNERPVANIADVNSLDNIIAALYDVISGPKGEARDWDRMRSLFMTDAKLLPTWKKEDGTVGHWNWTVDEYITRAGASLERDGFFETETHRVTEEYGTITHIFSTYDSRRTLEDQEPFARGINSIQLVKDDNRWYIMNIMWMGETETFPLPKKYTSKKQRRKKRNKKKK